MVAEKKRQEGNPRRIRKAFNMDNPDGLIGSINCLPAAILHLSWKIALTSLIMNGPDVRLPWVDNFFTLQ